MFEMEQVLPGCDPDDLDSDPILQAAACACGAGCDRSIFDGTMGELMARWPFT